MTRLENKKPLASRGFYGGAMHGGKLDGASPLWASVITNHYDMAKYISILSLLFTALALGAGLAASC
jgi:hypothetical protein